MKTISEPRTTDWSSTPKEFVRLVRDLSRSKSCTRIATLLALAVGVLLINVYGEVRMNTWRGAFYSAVEHKRLNDIWIQSGVFVLIMVILLSLVVSQNWLLERFRIRFREWLTHDLLDGWMSPSTAYRLSVCADDRLNPDQRIQEDLKLFSDLTSELGLGIARATLLLLSFVGVLWMMSSGIKFNLNGREFSLPGYMVWAALAYASLGTWLATRVGRPLVSLNSKKHTEEANFRYSLVRVNDNAESIAFYRGENDERKIVNDKFENVLDVSRIISFANARLTWVTCGHGWMVVLLPVIVALPGYLQGKLDFGGLMMVIGAFDQVQQSMRWYVENFFKIAEWQTCLHRLMEIRRILDGENLSRDEEGTISVRDHEDGHLEFQNTAVCLQSGKLLIKNASYLIREGERVLITGESGAGKSTMLRCVAGLWPWGKGTILTPSSEDTMFLPQKPYIPLGTLAAALCYPKGERALSSVVMRNALRRVNLEAFIPSLHVSARWDKTMSLGQQQRLAFARLLIHKPNWVFLDEATSALDDKNEALMMSIFDLELGASALISVGHKESLKKFHQRTLNLSSLAGDDDSGRYGKAKEKVRTASRNLKLDSSKSVIKFPAAEAEREMSL